MEPDLWKLGKVEKLVGDVLKEEYEKGKKAREKAKQYAKKSKTREVARRRISRGKPGKGMEEVKRLEDFERTRGKLRLPSDIKPCIVKLLEDPSGKEGDNPFIIGCELHRIGRTEKQIDSLLTRLGIKTSRIRGVIKSVASGKYEFGCPRLEEKGICLYKAREECFWYQTIPRESQKSYRERDFWRFDWPRRLTPPESMIYLAIKEVEKRKRYPAGSRLYVCYKDLAKTSGVSIGWILKCCERLRDKGLIEFKKGSQHRWYRRASEVKRIIPIPRPK